MADQSLINPQYDCNSIMEHDEAYAIADGIIGRRLAHGWSRQALLSSIEGGPTPCRRAFYVMRGGVIALALFPITQVSDITGRGIWLSIRDLFPPLPDHTHRSAEQLQPFQVGDKVWSWYKDEPSADYGQPDSKGWDSAWRRRPLLFTVRKVTGPHLEPGYYAGRAHYTVHLRHQEGPRSEHYDAGFYDLCPIRGRPWQMRGHGDFIQLAEGRIPAHPPQLDLFA